MSDPLGRLLAEHGVQSPQGRDPLDALIAGHGASSLSSSGSRLDASALPAIPVAQAEGTYRGPPRDNPHAKRLTGPARILTQYLAQPMVDNPISTVITSMAPPLAIAGAGMMAKDVVQYGAQKAAELTLPAHERSLAEADPNRIPGERAAVEAGMLAAPVVVGKALGAIGSRLGDVSEGMAKAGAEGVKETIAEQSPLWGPNRRPEYSLPIKQRLPREPGPNVEPVSVGGAPMDALDQLISTRQYLSARGRLEDVGPAGRRPVETLPITQRPAIEPPPDAATYSTKSTGVLRRPGGVTPPASETPTLRRVLTGEELGGPEVPTPELRELARKHAYDNLRGNTYRNAETEKGITVNRRGIDHTLTHAADDVMGRVHAQSIPALDQLLEDATYVGTEPPKTGVLRGTVAVHRFEKPMTIGDQPYTAHLVVKEAPDGHFFYDHKLTTIEPAEPSDVPFHQSQDGGDASGPSGSTSVESIRPESPEGNAGLGETQSFGGPTPGALEPVATARGGVSEVRPDIKRTVNQQVGPEPLSTPLSPPEGPATPGPSASDLLNVTKLDLGSKTAEQRVAQQLEQFRQLRESNKQTFAEADVNRREIMNELLANDPKALSPMAAKRLSGEELLARRDVVRQNDALIDQLSKQIESRELSVDDHAHAVDLMHKAVAQNDALLSDLVTGSSQKGRDLNLLRRMANRSLDPDVWMVQAKRMLGDQPLTDEIAAGIRRFVMDAAEACGGA